MIDSNEAIMCDNCYEAGYKDAIDKFYLRVITEIIAKGIYEDGRIIVHAGSLKSGIEIIANDLKKHIGE